jgi:hypothetical protein
MLSLAGAVCWGAVGVGLGGEAGGNRRLRRRPAGRLAGLAASAAADPDAILRMAAFDPALIFGWQDPHYPIVCLAIQ